MKRRVFGFYFTEIKLAEGDGDDSWTELLREGNFKHTLFGVIPITKALLASLKENFDKGVRGIDVATDYYHEWQKDASGWMKELDIRTGEDGKDVLFFRNEWTPKARQKITDKELRYVSADFSFNYEDNETGAKHGPTLLGAALTNRPHIKRMQALLSEADELSNEEMSEIFPDYKGDESMEFEKLLEALSNLTDDQKAQVAQKLGLKVEVKPEVKAESDDKMELSETEKATNAENVKLKEQIVTQEKKTSFDLMLDEGDVVEAQRVHFMSGDMAAFAKAKVEVNLQDDDAETSTTGTEQNKVKDKKSGKKGDELTKDQAEVKLDELAEEAMKKNEDLDYGTALSEAIGQNPELAKLVE